MFMTARLARAARAYSSGCETLTLTSLPSLRPVGGMLGLSKAQFRAKWLRRRFQLRLASAEAPSTAIFLLKKMPASMTRRRVNA
jgi:hypothetical protein